MCASEVTLACVSGDVDSMLRKHVERGESSSKTTILIRDMGREFLKIVWKEGIFVKREKCRSLHAGLFCCANGGNIHVGYC